MEKAYNSQLTRRKFLHLMLSAGAAAAVDWTRIDALAAEVKNKDDFPVVVIGAGLGGLVAAAYLAKHGFPVMLLEQHDVPGGYATAFDRAAGKFTFEVSLHATVAEGGIPQKVLSEIGIWEQLKVVYTPELCRLALGDYDLTLPARDPEKTKNILCDSFPDEKKGISAFISEMVQVQEEMRGFAGEDSVMARLEKITLDDWLARHVKSPKARELLSVFWGYYGLPPSRLNALFYAIATGQYLVTGGQYFKTRSQDLSNALMDAVTENGGEVLLETAVTRIMVRNKRVFAVVDGNGTHYPAKAVIANCNVPDLFGQLIPREKIPADYQKKLATYRPSLSSFIVWLGLKQELKDIKDYEIFVGDDEDADAAYHASLSGDLARARTAVAIYDNLYPGYSMPGTSTISIMSLCGYEPWRKFETDYFAGRKKAYAEEKSRLAQILVQKAQDRLIPHLTSMIEVMEAATPLTNVRYTGNYQGAISGFDRQGAKMNLLDVRTPINGLYLAGAWSHGGGYTSAMWAGRDAVRAFMADWASLQRTGD